YLFFQAEDGIRARNVTGVQTCALPIFARARPDLPGETDRSLSLRGTASERSVSPGRSGRARASWGRTSRLRRAAGSGRCTRRVRDRKSVAEGRSGGRGAGGGGGGENRA